LCSGGKQLLESMLRVPTKLICEALHGAFGGANVHGRICMGSLQFALQESRPKGSVYRRLRRQVREKRLNIFDRFVRAIGWRRRRRMGNACHIRFPFSC
jgi:hypothetical protein